MDAADNPLQQDQHTTNPLLVCFLPGFLSYLTPRPRASLARRVVTSAIAPPQGREDVALRQQVGRMDGHTGLVVPEVHRGVLLFLSPGAAGSAVPLLQVRGASGSPAFACTPSVRATEDTAAQA
jgi:hypothetical protein